MREKRKIREIDQIRGKNKKSEENRKRYKIEQIREEKNETKGENRERIEMRNER